MNRTSTFKPLSYCSVLFLSLLLLNTTIVISQPESSRGKKWVGTWSTGLQLVETRNNPPAPGLTGNSLRQVVRVSIGGKTLRLKLSNEFSKSPIQLLSVQIAASSGGSMIKQATNKTLTFKGSKELTLDAGASVTSDAFEFDLQPRMDLAITICFGSTPSDLTGHPGSRTTSYLLSGNNSSVTDFSGSVTTEHWYVINEIDVLTSSKASCVAILGNSITDGRGSTTDKQDRWPDLLSERLLANRKTNQIGVLNLGIGGNCVLRDCLGPAGVKRYENDILNKPGVKYVIVFEGVNDIGAVRTADAAASVANGLIAAYKSMIESAHARGLKIFGATITPFKGNGYYNQYSEECRTRINEWIRTSNAFDAVIDFDVVVRNPEDIQSLSSSNQNDGLHPDLQGFRKMADCINLSLF